jgi:putative spermidine/putrescine transport system substrate-binding protein
VPVELAIPNTGSVGWETSLHLVANAAEPELAVKYIDLHLEAPIQQEMLKAPYDAIPTNANVKFEGAITNAIAKSGADLTKVHHIDWAKLNPQRGALIDRFNREIKV